MVYIILYSGYQSKVVHHILQDQRKRKEQLHFLALALTLTLTLSLTLTFNHLANEPLQATIMLFSLMCLTYSSVTEHKYPIGCTMDYKRDVTKNR